MLKKLFEASIDGLNLRPEQKDAIKRIGTICFEADNQDANEQQLQKMVKQARQLILQCNGAKVKGLLGTSFNSVQSKLEKLINQFDSGEYDCNDTKAVEALKQGIEACKKALQGKSDDALHNDQVGQLKQYIKLLSESPVSTDKKMARQVQEMLDKKLFQDKDKLKEMVQKCMERINAIKQEKGETSDANADDLTKRMKNFAKFTLSRDDADADVKKIAGTVSKLSKVTSNDMNTHRIGDLVDYVKAHSQEYRDWLKNGSSSNKAASADGAQPTEGTTPADGTQPADGTKPADGTQPTDGAQPAGNTAATGDKKSVNVNAKQSGMPKFPKDDVIILQNYLNNTNEERISKGREPLTDDGKPLTVDGKFGPKTLKAMQRAEDKLDDGKWGPDSKAVYDVLMPELKKRAAEGKQKEQDQGKGTGVTPELRKTAEPYLSSILKQMTELKVQDPNHARVGLNMYLMKAVKAGVEPKTIAETAVKQFCNAKSNPELVSNINGLIKIYQRQFMGSAGGNSGTAVAQGSTDGKTPDGQVSSSTPAEGAKEAPVSGDKKPATPQSNEKATQDFNNAKKGFLLEYKSCPKAQEKVKLKSGNEITRAEHMWRKLVNLVKKNPDIKEFGDIETYADKFTYTNEKTGKTIYKGCSSDEQTAYNKVDHICRASVPAIKAYLETKKQEA